MKHFFKWSQKIGMLPDLVQGAGGNTSVKIGKMLYVKASGVLLRDVTHRIGYACCAHKPIARELRKGGVRNEKDYNLLITKHTHVAESFGEPSIDIALHVALPSRYVVHTHSVYANVFNCMQDGEELLRQALPGVKFSVIEYRNPGLALAWYFAKSVRDTKRMPGVIFMKNHGLITHGATSAAFAKTLLVNKKLKNFIQKRVGKTFQVHEKPVDLSRHLFPDSVVFAPLSGENLTGRARTTFYETTSATQYILEAINALGGIPLFLSEKDVQAVAALEKEKKRLTAAKKNLEKSLNEDGAVWTSQTAP